MSRIRTLNYPRLNSREDVIKLTEHLRPTGLYITERGK